jgi:nickel-type superoxide dismutase maturation protease
MPYSNQMRQGKTRASLNLWVRAVATATGMDRVTVTGLSMAPALLPGDRLLVLRTRRVRVGDTVVVRDPRDPSREVVKRVSALDPGGAVEVRGDHPAVSTDSRTFGTVPQALLVGRVIYRYAPAARIGRIMRYAR